MKAFQGLTPGNKRFGEGTAQTPKQFDYAGGVQAEWQR